MTTRNSNAVKHTPATPLRNKAAFALDASLDDAARKRGIYTDKARDTLAAYLDGAAKLKASTVRAYMRYLSAL